MRAKFTRGIEPKESLDLGINSLSGAISLLKELQIKFEKNGVDQVDFYDDEFESVKDVAELW